MHPNLCKTDVTESKEEEEEKEPEVLAHPEEVRGPGYQQGSFIPANQANRDEYIRPIKILNYW